jgi:hypothetical protein
MICRELELTEEYKSTSIHKLEKMILQFSPDVIQTQLLSFPGLTSKNSLSQASQPNEECKSIAVNTYESSQAQFWLDANRPQTQLFPDSCSEQSSF